MNTAQNIDTAILQDLAALGDLVRESVKALVDHPSRAEVEWTTGQAGMVLSIRVAPNELGQLLGRHGCHMDAMRRLATSVAGRLRRRIDLVVVEPPFGSRALPPEPPEATAAPDPFAGILSLLEGWVKLMVDDPHSIHVQLRTGQRSAKLSIHTGEANHRQVVGRHGAIVDALRVLFEPMARRHGWKPVIELVDPRYSPKAPLLPLPSRKRPPEVP